MKWMPKSSKKDWKAYRKVVKQVGIPGFRKGRVPRPLEAHYGKEILYQDALEVIVPEAYE